MTSFNQSLEADEVRLALDWQGFVVDVEEVEALVHEVGQRQGLNQPGAEKTKSEKMKGKNR